VSGPREDATAALLADAERRHVPRGRLYAAIPLQIESGLPVLPELVLWALSLDEGDLLTVSADLLTGSYLFQSYLAALEGILASVGGPWTYIEPLLRLPMAAVGCKHTLLLPEEAAALVEHEESALVLHATGEDHHGPGSFVLRVEERPPDFPVLSVTKQYTLPILSDFRVILPAEVLWLTGLRGGGRLACETFLGEAHYEPAAQVGHLGERFWVELEPDGLLTLPEPLSKLAGEALYRQVLLSVAAPCFQVRLWDDWQDEDALQRGLQRLRKWRLRKGVERLGQKGGELHGIS